MREGQNQKRWNLNWAWAPNLGCNLGQYGQVQSKDFWEMVLDGSIEAHFTFFQCVANCYDDFKGFIGLTQVKYLTCPCFSFFKRKKI